MPIGTQATIQEVRRIHISDEYGRRSSAVQRLQLSRFGPREERESKRIRRWAEVGSSAKSRSSSGAFGAAPPSQSGVLAVRGERLL